MLCGNCRLNKRHKTVEDYNMVRRSKKSNTIGRQVILDMGFSLTKDICVHHVDENPDNNNLTNLFLIGRRNHAKLHRLLEREWSLLLKNNDSDIENRWKTLRDKLTITWLETMNVQDIKITDIEQSVSMPLSEDIIYRFI